ncbi:MAG: UDP-glucose/GDP-mannose dehydrogenase family protein [Proteobacteria bacterium]|nr:UDP-glucose/GDP-mannose dehydrogenase family protein [Pseudomonadota bacterium]
MNISTFGLGYVGGVTAACLAKGSHNVIGVDVKGEKVEMINQGKAPFYEKDLDNLISQAVEENRLKATKDVKEAVENSEISLICVGTPSNPDGSLNLDYVKKVCEDIGTALKYKNEFHVVVIRSTILPGSTENVLIPILEKASEKKSSGDFGVCVNPEFMREGQAIYDFFNPERIVIGETDKRSGDHVAQIYNDIHATVIRTDIKTAEMVKYVDNTFHAIKVTFANEIGSVCKRLGIDAHEIMNIFCMDKKLNLSPYYFKPGFAFGGSCLTKDLSALLSKAGELKLSCPLLEAIIPSNQEHIDKVVELIISQNKRRIGVFGLSFKSGTSDTRESPVILAINRLYEKGYAKLFEKGYEISVFDPNLDKSDMENLPSNIVPLLSPSLEEVVEKSEVLVIANNDKDFKRIPSLMREGQVLIDLVKVIEADEVKDGEYIGVCW